MQLNRRQADRIFRILRVQHRPSTHHVAGLLVIDEARVLRVHYSRGTGDFPLPMVHRFRTSLHLDVDEFRRLRDGKMDRAEYLAIVKPRLPIVED